MKYILPLAFGAFVAEAQLIQRDDANKTSKSAPNTVYTFLGSGSNSNVLQMSKSGSSPTESSDSGRESSALSQLLHGTNTGDSVGLPSASATSSPSGVSLSGGSSNTSNNSTGPNSGGVSPSSTKSASSSGVANHLGAPVVAGGVAIAALALL